MTVTNGTVKFSDTIRFLYRIQTGYQISDVLGFQTTITPVSSGVDDNGARVMILHIPSDKPLNIEDNLLDATSVPNVLEDMRLAISPDKRAGQFACKTVADNPDIYDYGIFKIFTINEPKAYLVNRALLDYFEPEERPALVKPEVINFYYWRYPNCKLIVCCFNILETTRSLPLLVKYQPSSNNMTLPGIVSVTGFAPDTQVRVYEDSTLIISADAMPQGKDGVCRVIYRDPIPSELQGYIPSHVLGAGENGVVQNCDFSVNPVDLVQGKLSFERSIKNSI